MNYFAPRTCTEVPESNSHEDRSPSLPLEQFRDNSCYVLLGSPGAGKTKAFKREAEQEKGFYVTAREFINIPDRPEWHGATLFIDGLDEMRAGVSDQRTPFDQIRGKLQKLGRPRFRLSCREADWFGANDRNHLKDVSSNGKLRVLRLDPLSPGDILKILRCNHGVNKPELFVASAEEKGIGVLLANPQSLKMLASAVTDENWPETRMETFDLACRNLLEEHNEEHQLANLDAVDIQELLNMTGKLCAIQLLSGQTGYSLIGKEENCGYINLKKIHGEKQRSLRKVLRSKLFECQDETHIIPVHRQVAEFLSGRYLAKLMQEGLPTRRILALMTGYDGGIVSELRGLSAWLAAHSPESRKETIERDPLGVILYGDIRSFSVSERRQILTRIANETKKNPWLINIIGHEPYLEYLATPDVQVYFQSTLTDPARDDAQQSFVIFLLETLQHGSSIPELGDVLLGISRDDSWRPEVRSHALRAFIQQQKTDNKTITELATLLEDVDAGSVSDPNDELLGIILRELYPHFLSASDVLKYLKAPKASNVYGSYALFWFGRLVEQSIPTRLAELLDGLYICFVNLSPEHEIDDESESNYSGKYLNNLWANYETTRWQRSFFSAVFPILLARLLKITGDKVSLDRLSNWLWVISDFGVMDRNKSKMEIRRWLNNNPEIQKVVFEKWMERDEIDPHEIELRLFHTPGLGTTHPPDFGLWCLNKAITTTDYQFKRFFLRTVAEAIENESFNKELSQKIVEEKLINKPSLKQEFLELQADHNRKSRQHKSFAEKQKAKRQQEIRKQVNYVKSHEEELRENRCPPWLIHHLASVYFGEDENFIGDDLIDNLRDFLGNNENLGETIRKAFRESVFRSDVPSAVEIIRLRENNETHHMALPFLVGMEEIFKNMPQPEEVPTGEKQLRQALAFYYNTPLPASFSGSQPLWYCKLLISNPDTVSDVLISSALSRIHKSKETLPNLRALAFQDDHAQVASLVTLRLLEKFPVRCTAKQKKGLNYLLKAALLHCEEKPFLDMVNKKLSCSSMNVAQRIYWLAAGLVASPTSFIEKLETYISSKERRVKNLLEFIINFPEELMKRLDIFSIKFFISLIGSSYRPHSYSSDFYQSRLVGPPIQVSECIYELIQQLASNQSSSASQALEELSSDDSLRSWKASIIDASYRQKSIRREASFSYSNVNQVLETLDNKNPANVADLSALTMDILSYLAQYIRRGDTSDWRQYWCIENNKPQDPQHENECRNRLLSDLKKRFEQLGINASLESHYADSNRPDISITHNGYKVPIEIKKSDHRKLWSAIRTQLIAKYARDPETDGYGIYLVFWFGEKFCQIPGSGTRPQSAMELKERLIDCLTTDKKRKISVCVIDVAKA